MKDISAGRIFAMFERYEGKKPFAYLDIQNKVTVGIGRNLTDVGLREDEILMLFWNDYETAENELQKYGFYKELGDARQLALLHMMFNLGASKFRQFTEMITALEDGCYIIAAEEMLDSLWAEQVGNRAFELAAMMETDKLPEWV